MTAVKKIEIFFSNSWFCMLSLKVWLLLECFHHSQVPQNHISSFGRAFFMWCCFLFRTSWYWGEISLLWRISRKNRSNDFSHSHFDSIILASVILARRKYLKGTARKPIVRSAVESHCLNTLASVIFRGIQRLRQSHWKMLDSYVWSSLKTQKLQVCALRFGAD